MVGGAGKSGKRLNCNTSSRNPLDRVDLANTLKSGVDDDSFAIKFSLVGMLVNRIV